MRIQDILKETDATLNKRTLGARKLFESEEMRRETVKIIQNQDKEFSLKALMVMEILGRDHFEMLEPYIPAIIKSGNLYTDSSCRRCLAKIYNFAIASYKSPNTNFNLSSQLKSEIIKQSFLWLVSKEKTAVKVFSMQNIFELRNEESWVSDQLQGVLEKDMVGATPGFRSRGIKILRKLKQ